MRSSISRITLRGARRIANPSGASRGNALALRSNPFRRELCSSSAVASEPKQKPDESEPKNVEHIGIIDASAKPQPAVEVLTEDATVFTVNDATLSPVKDAAESSVQPVIPSLLPTETASDAVDPPGISTDADADAGFRSASTADESERRRVKKDSRDSTVLLHDLKDMLQKNTVRSALWNFGNALKTNGGATVDSNVMKLMLPIMGRNSWSDSAGQTLALAIERGYNLGCSSFNSGLHAMARSGDAEAISNILEGMWSLTSDSHPNASSYNYLIAAHMYGGKVDAAFAVLSEMKKHLIYPTFATYHALITGCLRRRDPRRAFQTLLAVEKQRYDISAMTIAQVLVASANNDDYDHVLSLLTKFDDALPRYGTELHRIAEYRGTYRLSTEERTSKAERDVIRGHPKPELGAISAVLHCAFRGGRADIANRSWELLTEYYPDFEAPLSFWYCLVGAHAGAGEFGKAIDIVGVMREKGLQPMMRDLDLALIRPLAYDVAAIDEQYYRLCDRADGKETSLPADVPSTSLSGNGANSDTASPEESHDAEPNDEDQAKILGVAEIRVEDPAVKILGDSSVEEGDPVAKRFGDSVEVSVEEELAASEKIDGTPETIETESFADALLKPEVSAQWKGTRSVEFSPKTVGIDEVNCIIAACSTSQDLDRAFQTYDEVETRFKLERNIDTYNALLEGCVQTRRLSGGLRVLEEIKKVGLNVSGHTVHLAARLMLRGGRSEDVMALLKKTWELGNVVPLQTLQMVLKQFTRAEALDPAVEIVKLGEEAGFDFRMLTGRFDFESLKKLYFAVYGVEFQVHSREDGMEKGRRSSHTSAANSADDSRARERNFEGKKPGGKKPDGGEDE